MWQLSNHYFIFKRQNFSLSDDYIANWTMFVIYAAYFLTIYTNYFYNYKFLMDFLILLLYAITIRLNRMLCSIVCWQFYINRVNESYQSNETETIESTKLMNIVEHQKIKRWVEIWYMLYRYFIWKEIIFTN